MTTEQFELRKARRWPWLAALAAIAALAVAFWWWRGYAQAPQVVFGTTLKIHYEPAMAGEQRIIEYISQHIAPDYGLKLEAVGVQDRSGTGGQSRGGGAVCRHYLSTSVVA